MQNVYTFEQLCSKFGLEPNNVFSREKTSVNKKTGRPLTKIYHLIDPNKENTILCIDANSFQTFQNDKNCLFMIDDKNERLKDVFGDFRDEYDLMINPENYIHIYVVEKVL